MFLWLGGGGVAKGKLSLAMVGRCAGRTDADVFSWVSPGEESANGMSRSQVRAVGTSAHPAGQLDPPVTPASDVYLGFEGDGGELATVNSHWQRLLGATHCREAVGLGGIFLGRGNNPLHL